MAKEIAKKMPPAQALLWVIEGAQTALELLKELQIEWERKRALRQDGSAIRKHQRVILDAFTIYIASLFDTRSETHSLVKSYLPHKFIQDFRKKEVVQKCLTHRHNRAGHQSQRYGFIIPLDLVLLSDIDAWLTEASYAVATGKLPIK